MDIIEIISSLHEIAYNLWWTWNPEAQEIFAELSPYTWRFSNHNPVAVLKHVSEQELSSRLHETDFSQRIEQVVEEFRSYMAKKSTWCENPNSTDLEEPIAYFSAEFGLHECLPIYSGGLGILAGDFTKSASDLGIPFVGISLFYRYGYFQQRIAPDGWQHEEYPAHDPATLPIKLVADDFGIPIIVSVEINHTNVSFHAWEVNVGRAKIYLLDTNRPENEEHLRDLTGRVYGGDTSIRISQEIVLGIGGVRLLRALGITPRMYHMNEGHSAFLTLELLREQLAEGKTPEEAHENIRTKCLFTTHTPVPAGHDRFTPGLFEFMFSRFSQNIPLPMKKLLAYGKVNPDDDHEQFCMTVLALRMSAQANGVSELHGEVSREMWKSLYPSVEVDKIPIGHVTNGIYTAGWALETAHQFWKKRFGFDWTERLLDQSYWKELASGNYANDGQLWALRYTLRRNLIEFVRRRLREQHTRHGEDAAGIFDSILSADKITICFARRFATYKRAPLLFRNMERIIDIVNNPHRPAQIIFSGKAHPRDDDGKRFIKFIIEMTRHPQLFGKVIFLEDYDINVARYLVAGADVWLNTPRRPLEASGTSGMKIAIHGGLHVSTLDGWWREAFDGENGWAIGEDAANDDQECQDAQDAASLYKTLEQDIVPLFYQRDADGIPHGWIRRIRHSMSTIIPAYSAERMVADYIKKYYHTIQ